jgi:RNA polymerase sigma-70 factor (ECF subfamily)
MRRVKRWHERERPIEDAVDVGATPRQAEPDLKSRLRSAIEKLPETHRVVFVMFDVEGYTHEEIAAELGITAGGSKSQLFKARAKLRTLLAHMIDAPSDSRLQPTRSHVAPVY